MTGRLRTDMGEEKFDFHGTRHSEEMKVLEKTLRKNSVYPTGQLLRQRNGTHKNDVLVLTNYEIVRGGLDCTVVEINLFSVREKIMRTTRHIIAHKNFCGVEEQAVYAFISMQFVKIEKESLNKS